jgi:putative tricarboxylic transport membrane protein
MRIKWGQDLATGLMFLAFGLGALWTIYFYDKLSMGTAQRPGTGVLPVILAWCLMGTGVLLAVKSVLGEDELLSRWAWRPLFLVTLAVVSFGLFVDDLGLIPTMLIAMTLCACASLETRWQEFAIFSAVMVLIGWGTFIWLLGMPVPALPTKVPSFLTSIWK